MRTFVLVAGILLTLWTVQAMIQSMLVPRGSRSIIARGVDASVSGLATAPLFVFGSYRRQDRWLAGAAPISVLMQLIVYVVILIFTLGLVVYGLTPLSWTQSFFQSGSTLTTLGIVEPVNIPSAITTFIAAFLGLVVIAVFIGYLMAIYGALVSRESQMARLALLSGEPAWGPQILARGHILGLPDDQAPSLTSWVDWICDVRLNQQVNPLLAYFRSTGPTRHWVVSILAVLDSVALRLSLSEGERDPHAIPLIAQGTIMLNLQDHKLHWHMHDWDLERLVGQAIEGRGPNKGDAGLSEEDWREAMGALHAAGYPLPDDLDKARNTFFRLRSLYAPAAYALAKKYHAVPAPWSGPRKPSLPTIWPQLATRQQ